MAGLILRKEEFSLPPHRQWRWQTATRKMSLPNIPMSSASWCWCGEATGCTSLTIARRITRGDLFYIRAEDKHSYASVNDLVLQNIIYCPERLQLNFDWAGAIRPLRHAVEAPLAHGQHRYGAGAPVISQRA